ncbi:hypothetical protein BC834DRAFT_1040245 [Gloeopeniophorella convolvens]|nr:hypothetical protein BC834DRAFT_1040245 [Gloeopeniophorella convolvens]
MDKPSFSSPPRRSHRKRFSGAHLSSDTTSTLPVYSRAEDYPYDRPPDYPESANEADADTDNSTSDTLPPLSSPRSRRPFSHRRRHSASPIASSSSGPYLDSLLARSVHALEMSNALLQSSMSTHSSLSAVLAADSPVADTSLEARAHDLTSRIRVNSNVHANWMDDLAVISEHIINDSRTDALGLGLGLDDAVSQSLPVGPSPLELRSRRSHRNRSSFDLRQVKAAQPDQDQDEPQLHLSHWPRSRLISPAPRAITQYVEANADPDTIELPSTLGLRSSPSTHFPAGTSSPPPAAPPLQPSTSPPNSISAEPSTAAHTLLSSFLSRRSSTGSTASRLSFRSHSQRRARTSLDKGSSSRASSAAAQSRTPTPLASPRRSRASKRSSSSPPIPPISLPSRSLTPPIENPSLSSLSSNSSSDPSTDPHPNPVLSLQALRKILDDQPRSQPMSRTPSESPAQRRQAFLPRTPLPAPTLGTSTATASVSRLFTKPVHMHSGSSSRELRPSALKGGLRTPQSPASPNGFLSAGPSTGAAGSTASSGHSTPKRISFAELPESYGRGRGGGSGRGFEKARSKKAKKRAARDKGKSRADGDDDSDDDDDDEEERGWWARLLLGGGGSRGAYVGRAEERIESRMSRGLGSRGGFGGIEDWAV